jgi:hypothetical protein
VVFEIETKGKSWSVKRKDKDFFRLRAILSKLYPGCVITLIPSNPLTKFDTPSLEKHKLSLQHFLDETLAHPLLSTAEILTSFLSSTDKDFEQQCLAYETLDAPKSVAECFTITGSTLVSYNHTLAEYCVSLSSNSLVLKSKFSE